VNIHLGRVFFSLLTKKTPLKQFNWRWGIFYLASEVAESFRGDDAYLVLPRDSLHESIKLHVGHKYAEPTDGTGEA
jgi:hypothetical protein